MLLGILTAGECQVDVLHSSGPLAPLAAQLGLVMQQDLPLGHPADVAGLSVSSGDEGGVDVRPARTAAAAFSATTRVSTLRI